ncbi:hypothetical protein HHI36_010331 [Cryptolaemus montrouzieri]|uniref:PiggyBac transposable element-derived protein domain-containing protein n=1 Tax=Cryptolaemus montrouzieri TaxID=559131 RepID=A0ABD2MIB0_9CUCU
MIGGIPEKRCRAGGIISGCEDPVILETDYNEDVDSAVEASSTDRGLENVSGPSQSIYYRKNQFKWSKNSPGTSPTRQHNIVRQRPGFIGPDASKSYMTTKETFEFLVDDNIIQIINNYTNRRLTRIRKRLPLMHSARTPCL